MIKNIIFDIGGVLIDLNVRKTFDCFGGRFQQYFEKKMPNEFEAVLKEFERGEISADKFRNETSKIFAMRMSRAGFDLCWNAMVGQMDTNTILMLLELRKKYRLFVLSNINEIHYDYLVSQDYWEPALFEETYFSHLMGMRKPEKRIFEFVLSENDLATNETFYIDDTKEHILTADSLGIQTLHYNGKIPIYKQISDLFNFNLPELL